MHLILHLRSTRKQPNKLHKNIIEIQDNVKLNLTHGSRYKLKDTAIVNEA